MSLAQRFLKNPILYPDSTRDWEAEGTFNPCVIKKEDKYYLLYRAYSSAIEIDGKKLNLSTIGKAVSDNGIKFNHREQLIKPEYEWEKYGCEDPRVIFLNDNYYIFYTAISNYPPGPNDIKIGLAISPDLKDIKEKHLLTHFNSKAMSLFPEKINGQYWGILTIHTDRPPGAIVLVKFSDLTDLWSQDFWQEWLTDVNEMILPLCRDSRDHVEVGAPPIKTEKGWLLIYSYIKNYFSPPRTLRVEAALIDLTNPLNIKSVLTEPLLIPEENYELYGLVPDVVFPTGAIINEHNLNIYYGAADTYSCLATIDLAVLLKKASQKQQILKTANSGFRLTRYKNNPIITPRAGYGWEAGGTFNPAAVREDGKFHILYRAFSDDNISSLGYASSDDGFKINVRSETPVYLPRASFEQKAAPGLWSGCEDPRITRFNNDYYMCYTAYDGKNPTRVALTKIKVKDLVNQNWNWTKPQLISPPAVDDKNTCILPETINGKYLFFHRINPCIWLDWKDKLDFKGQDWIAGKILMQPRTNNWDNRKIGIAAPPIKTEDGWLMFYHGLAQEDHSYHVSAALLDLNNPEKILLRPRGYLLGPEKDYERGKINVVFPCAVLLVKDKLYVYYGAADKYLGVAYAGLKEVLTWIKTQRE